MRSQKMVILLVICFGLVFSSSVFATNYTFNPVPIDMQGLDHYFFYSWNISMSLSANENVESATLTIKNIWDWTAEADDSLFIWLLDDPQVNSTTWPGLIGSNSYSKLYGWQDMQLGGDNWGQIQAATGIRGYRLTTWSDPNGGSPANYDFVFSFNNADLAMLTQYAQNGGTFALGVDPDCHYFNDGVELRVVTPEPSTLLLLGFGLVSVGLIGRKKFDKR